MADSRDTAREPKYEVLWPLSRRAVRETKAAKRLPDLNGKVVAELWDVIFRGETIYPLVREHIRKRFPGREVRGLRGVRQLPRRARARGVRDDPGQAARRTRPTR